MSDYAAFLASKHAPAPEYGLDVPASDINPLLFGFQSDIVRWALKRGRAAIWADCGLGKGPMALEWARHVCRHTGGDVLILAPLAVAQQFAREAVKFGQDITVCRTSDDVRPGINVTNYDMLQHFDPSAFVGVVLDESSLLKNFTGATKQRLVVAFSQTPYRLCCTATPAPNDRTEIATHAEFLGIMPRNEILARWFINDTMDTGVWRLKGYAEQDFYEWISSWAISLRRPSDIGYDDDGFVLPALNLIQERVDVDLTEGAGDFLFRMPSLSATGIHDEMRLTAPARAAAAAALVNDNAETWIVWCNTNYEADALVPLIPGAVEVRGSETPQAKERKLLDFSEGRTRVLISKPSVCGWGLNWQHCHKVVFVGLSYSFEALYQALRRTYRFGQGYPVDAHLITAQTEGPILAAVQAKMAAHEDMMAGLNGATGKLAHRERLRLMNHIDTTEQTIGNHRLIHADCVSTARQMPPASIDFSIFSPPFSELFTYSDDIADMGNSVNDDQFFAHFDYLIPELHRVTRPGRLCAVHCRQMLNLKWKTGRQSFRDFRGDIIRHFTDAGWAYHSEVCIWKDPVIEMQRTKAHGLLYKQLRADSTFSRQGMAEYLLVFRRWPESEDEEASVEAVTHTSDEFPLDVWQRYASPIWMDIRQTNVLNVQASRDEKSEKHICPLQLDVIERALELWTNPGDTVLDPFAGIGSTAYVCEKLGRQSIGVELKDIYWQTAIRNVQNAVDAGRQVDLFAAAGLSLEEHTAS